MQREDMIEKVRQVRRAVRNGMSVTAAREAAGLPASTWARWNKKLGAVLPEPRRKSRRTSAGRLSRGGRK